MRARPSRISPAAGIATVRGITTLVAVAITLSPPPRVDAVAFDVTEEPGSPCLVLHPGDCISDGSATGAPYASNSSCTIAVLVPGTLRSRVFDTERGYDILTVNAVPYSGNTGPNNVNVVAGDTITWVTDETKAWRGWTVCLDTGRSNTQVPSADEEAGNPTGVNVPSGMVDFTGIVTDTFCLGTVNTEDFTNVTLAASNHTKACMVHCWEIDSGFSLLEKLPDVTAGFTYQSKYQLDLAGTEKILQLLTNPVASGGTCKRKNITVRVIGTPGSEVQYTGTTSNFVNGVALGNHMAVHRLWEVDPYDCCRQKSQVIPMSDCAETESSGGEHGEVGEAGSGATACTDLTSNPSNCSDVDIGASRDICDDNCTYYDHFPNDCGHYDNDDFVAARVCCACSGGVASAVGTKDEGLDTITIIVSVVAGFLLLFLIGVRLRHWRQRAAHLAAKDFTPWLQDLNLDGVLATEDLSSEPNDRVVPHELKRSSVELIKIIGSGEFGQVWHGTYRPPRGSIDGALGRSSNAFVIPVAVKELRDDPSAHEREELMREAAITAQFDHVNVLGLIGVVTAGEPSLLVLQFCDKGALSSLLQDSKASFELGALIRFCCDAAKGMAYLTERRFVHRDLAARNVLVSTFNQTKCNAKIADFGMSRDILESEYYKSVDSNAKLPLRWTSIEAIKYQRYGEKSDVWSFGVLCYEIFAEGQLPYREWMNWYVMEMVTVNEYKLPRPPRCPQDFYTNVLRPCLETLPVHRPTFSELVIRATIVAEATKGASNNDAEYINLEAASRKNSRSFYSSDGVADTFTDVAYVTPVSVSNVVISNPISDIVIKSGEPDDVITMTRERRESLRQDRYAKLEGAGSRASYQPKSGAAPHTQLQQADQYVPVVAAGPGAAALYTPIDGPSPQPPTAVVIKRTEELEKGNFVTPLEAQMCKALQLIDEDDAFDHILKIRRLTDAELSKVVMIDGVPWLATEIDLLGEFPEDRQPAFRKRAHDRAKKLLNARHAWAKPHPDFLMTPPAQLQTVIMAAAEEETFGFEEEETFGFGFPT